MNNYKITADEILLKYTEIKVSLFAIDSDNDPIVITDNMLMKSAILCSIISVNLILLTYEKEATYKIDISRGYSYQYWANVKKYLHSKLKD